MIKKKLNRKGLGPVKRYDKQSETDGQMLLRVGKKFALLVGVILMFDSLLDLLMGLIDLATELLHLVIELVESGLEAIIEHFLSTHHHETETMIANVVIVIFIIVFVVFLKLLPKLFTRLRRNTKAACLRRERRAVCEWEILTLNRKVKIVCVYVVGFSCVLFLLTL